MDHYNYDPYYFIISRQFFKTLKQKTMDKRLLPMQKLKEIIQLLIEQNVVNNTYQAGVKQTLIEIQNLIDDHLAANEFTEIEIAFLKGKKEGLNFSHISNVDYMENTFLKP